MGRWVMEKPEVLMERFIREKNMLYRRPCERKGKIPPEIRCIMAAVESHKDEWREATSGSAQVATFFTLLLRHSATHQSIALPLSPCNLEDESRPLCGTAIRGVSHLPWPSRGLRPLPFDDATLVYSKCQRLRDSFCFVFCILVAMVSC